MYSATRIAIPYAYTLSGGALPSQATYHQCQNSGAQWADMWTKVSGVVQVKILSQLIGVVKANMVPVPLWPEGQSHASNADFVRAHLVSLLASSFPNMTQPQVQHVVDKMFQLVDDYTQFKDHCRDFLVQTKEFGSANNDELYAEEKAREQAARAAQVPGLMKPEDVSSLEAEMGSE
jgi:exportin-1